MLVKLVGGLTRSEATSRRSFSSATLLSFCSDSGIIVCCRFPPALASVVVQSHLLFPLWYLHGTILTGINVVPTLWKSLTSNFLIIVCDVVFSAMRITSSMK